MDSVAVLRCPACNCENSAQYRFCCMCGARLVRPQARTSPLPQTPPQLQTKPPQKPAPLAVDHVSLLDLGGESHPHPEISRSGRADYLLEEAVEPPSRRARMHLAFALLLVAGLVIAWQWHRYGYPWNPLITAPAQQTDASPSASIPAQSDSDLAVQAKPSPATLASPANQAPVSSEPAATAVSAASSKPDESTPSNTEPPSTPAAPAETSVNAADPAAVEQASPSRAPADQSVRTTKSAGQRSGGQGDDAPATPSNQPTATLVTQPAPAQTQLMPVATAPAAPAPVLSDAQMVAEGQKYLYGDGVPEDCERARKSLLAASARNSTAQSLLGTMYASGHCVTRDLPSAYRWYARALKNDPTNNRIESDLKVLWQQMTPAEQQLAGGK